MCIKSQGLKHCLTNIVKLSNLLPFKRRFVHKRSVDRKWLFFILPKIFFLLVKWKCLFRITVAKVRDFKFLLFWLWTNEHNKRWPRLKNVKLLFCADFVYISLSQIKRMVDYLQFIIHTIIAISSLIQWVTRKV